MWLKNHGGTESRDKHGLEELVVILYFLTYGRTLVIFQEFSV